MERAPKDFLLEHTSSRKEVGEINHDLPTTDVEEIEDKSGVESTVQLGLLDVDSTSTFIVIQRDGGHVAKCDANCTEFHPGITVGGYTNHYKHSDLPHGTIREYMAKSLWSRRINSVQDTLNSRSSDNHFQDELQKEFDALGCSENCQMYWGQFLLETARDAFEGIPIRIVDKIEGSGQSLDGLKQQGYIYFDGSVGR